MFVPLSTSTTVSAGRVVGATAPGGRLRVRFGVMRSPSRASCSTTLTSSRRCSCPRIHPGISRSGRDRRHDQQAAEDQRERPRRASVCARPRRGSAVPFLVRRAPAPPARRLGAPPAAGSASAESATDLDVGARAARAPAGPVEPEDEVAWGSVQLPRCRGCGRGGGRRGWRPRSGGGSPASGRDRAFAGAPRRWGRDAAGGTEPARGRAPAGGMLAGRGAGRRGLAGAREAPTAATRVAAVRLAGLLRSRRRRSPARGCRRGGGGGGAARRRGDRDGPCRCAAGDWAAHARAALRRRGRARARRLADSARPRRWPARGRPRTPRQRRLGSPAGTVPARRAQPPGRAPAAGSHPRAVRRRQGAAAE